MNEKTIPQQLTVYDVVIIGGGGSALSCAIAAKTKGLKVIIVSKSSITSSQTAQAQGGINSVFGNTDDTVESHISDTLKSASGVGDHDAISFMCKNGSNAIEWLDGLGVPFSRNDENGIAKRKLGGASYKRACYSSDYTGLKILHTLYDTAIKLDIEIIEHCMLLDLIKKENEVVGITYLDIKTTEVKYILSSNTVLATGGYSGVYNGFTTNNKNTTGDGVVAGFRAGVELENMEFVQFHPTALKDKFILISESARGEGGYLVDKDGNRFVDELLPRDIVAREIYKKIKNNEEVFLDLRHLGHEKVFHLLPQEYKLILQFTSLKMDEDLIPITPAAHYTMGGLKCNKDSETSLNNLYAIGEVCSNGVHGANRLGGNSLLEIIVFGKQLGDSLKAKNISADSCSDCVKEAINKNKESINKLFIDHCEMNFYLFREKLGIVMFENVGLFRSDKTLNIALEFIEYLENNMNNFGIEDKSTIFNTNLLELFEFKNMVICSKAIILSALNRRESRGSHYREDFQSSVDTFEFKTIIDNSFKIKMVK